jgi:hypothetical protein
MVVMLGKALRYLGLHAVIYHWQRSLYLFAMPSIPDVYGVCVCVCERVLLWPCTLRVWAVTVRQLCTFSYTFSNLEANRETCSSLI